jgi:hypothetical protein
LATSCRQIGEGGRKILRQSVAESGKTQIGVILQQLVAELPWGHTSVGKNWLIENQQDKLGKKVGRKVG